MTIDNSPTITTVQERKLH